MQTMKRAAAGFCGLLVLLSGNPGLFSALAADAEGVLIKADQVETMPGETVSFRISLEGTAESGGFAAGGIRLFYDPMLEPVLRGETTPVFYSGAAMGYLSPYVTADTDQHILVIGTIGTENCTADGEFVSVLFQTPADAKYGDTYPMKLSVDQWLDENGDAVPCQTADGWIKISGAPTHGTCGSGLYWTLTDQGELQITGSGGMVDYAAEEGMRSPWYERREEIKTVSIGEKVSDIGDNAFADCTALESVALPASVQDVGYGAFSGCDALTDVYIRNTECVLNDANSDTFPAAAVIHGYADSSAEAYAGESGRTFEPIAPETETTTTVTSTDVSRTTTSTALVTSGSTDTGTNSGTSPTGTSDGTETQLSTEETTTNAETTVSVSQTASGSTDAQETTTTKPGSGETTASVSGPSETTETQTTISTASVSGKTETTVSTVSTSAKTSGSSGTETTISTGSTATTSGTSQKSGTETTSGTTVTTSPDSLPGDVNGDKVVDENDLDLLTKYLNHEEKLTEQGLRNADFNNDNLITQEDVDLLTETVQKQSSQTTTATTAVTQAPETSTTIVSVLEVIPDENAAKKLSGRYWSNDNQTILEGVQATVHLYLYCMDAQHYLLDADGKPAKTAEGNNILYDESKNMHTYALQDPGNKTVILRPAENLNTPAKIWQNAESPQSGKQFTVNLYYVPDEADGIDDSYDAYETVYQSYTITIDEYVILRGDANGDQSVDSLDATIVLQIYTQVSLSYQELESREREEDGKTVKEYVVGKKPGGVANWVEESVFYETCDIDGDKDISINDAMAILIHYTSNELAHVPLTWEEILESS